MRDMMAEDEIFLMGHISGLYGVRGWLRVHSYCRDAGDILSYQNWWLQRPLDNAGNPAGDDAAYMPWRTARLVKGRPQGKGLVAQIAPEDAPPIEDRDEAAAWVGARIGIARSDLPAAEGDEVYLADLLGLRVVNTREQELGRVGNIVETGAHPVLDIKNDGSSLLLPFVRDVYVLGIDLEEGRITVDWEIDY